jgi:predicted nucleic acid-binding protein
MVEPVIVDANPIISALLGGSARQVLFAANFKFYSTQFTLFEVAKYLPRLAQRLDRRELDLFREFELLPITACQPVQYETQLGNATELIGSRDGKDVPILALALELGHPLWTEDADFDGIAGITLRRTAEMLARLSGDT